MWLVKRASLDSTAAKTAITEAATAQDATLNNAAAPTRVQQQRVRVAVQNKRAVLVKEANSVRIAHDETIVTTALETDVNLVSNVNLVNHVSSVSSVSSVNHVSSANHVRIAQREERVKTDNLAIIEIDKILETTEIVVEMKTENLVSHVSAELETTESLENRESQKAIQTTTHRVSWVSRVNWLRVSRVRVSLVNWVKQFSLFNNGCSLKSSIYPMVVLLLLAFSCSRRAEFSTFTTVSEDSWSSGQQVESSYTISTVDTTSLYDISVVVRHNHLFKGEELILELISPSKMVYKQTVSISPTQNNSSGYLFKEAVQKVAQNCAFLEEGSYIFKINHTQQTPIKGVSEVGVVINKL